MPTKAETNGRGYPRAFSSAEELAEKFNGYIEHCHKIDYMPNIAGFCRFCGINRDTYYSQKEYYSDTIKDIEGILEDEALNTKSVNDTMKIFYMKNKFSDDYKDRHDIAADVSAQVDISITRDEI